MTELTHDRLDKIEAAAKAAKPGPYFVWEEHAIVVAGTPNTNTPEEVSGHITKICEFDPEDYFDKDPEDYFDEDTDDYEEAADAASASAEATAAYIASVDPQTVLAMVEEIRRLQKAMWGWSRGLVGQRAYTEQELREIYGPYIEDGNCVDLSPREARTVETLVATGAKVEELRTLLSHLPKTSEIDLALLALNDGSGIECRQDFCQCDPDTGMSPCQYCAIFSPLERLKQVSVESESKQ